MENSLPPRPNLDHLRRQAKSLLAALERGDKEAVSTIRQHLPAAKGMNDEQIRGAKLRLADAQSAIARQTGFAGWPQLSRHVEELRGLEGTWEFENLEVDGTPIPASSLSTSRILIDGDRFRTESPEATYEGVFNINVESDPHDIDIEFIAGPEAGNTNHGIFRLSGDRLEICLDVNGRPRPTAFCTAAGSGHAFEVLRRSSRARPDSVTGGVAQRPNTASADQSSEGFEYVASPLMTRLQGEWVAEKVVRDGQELPKFMLASGRRVASKNEIKISFGGQVMIHALVRVDECADPVRIDYFNLAGMSKGMIQLGIMQWRGDTACFCIAAPDQPRPTEFTSAAGSGRTLSHWRAK